MRAAVSRGPLLPRVFYIPKEVPHIVALPGGLRGPTAVVWWHRHRRNDAQPGRAAAALLAGTSALLDSCASSVVGSCVAPWYGSMPLRLLNAPPLVVSRSIRFGVSQYRKMASTSRNNLRVARLLQQQENISVLVNDVLCVKEQAKVRISTSRLHESLEGLAHIPSISNPPRLALAFTGALTYGATGGSDACGHEHRGLLQKGVPRGDLV